MTTGQEMLNGVKITLRDEVGEVADQLWKEPELLGYYNEAEREACRRADLIVDHSIAAHANITVVMGTAEYALSPLVLQIFRARIGTSVPVLVETTEEVMDQTDPGWEIESGTPRNYIAWERLNIKKIKLYPNPIAGGTLVMSISRLPLTDILLGTSPEIATLFHDDLKNYILYLAYTKQDTVVDQLSKTNSQRKEKFYIKEFENRFGPKKIPLSLT